MKNTTQDEMGFSLGIFICIGLGLAIWIIRTEKNESGQNICLIKICFLLGLIAVLFTSIYFPWDILAQRSKLVSKYLCMIQYPWRYLAIASAIFSVVVVAVFMAAHVKMKDKNYKVLLESTILISIISTGFYFYQFTAQSPSYFILSEMDRNDFRIGNKEYLLSDTDVIEMKNRKVICSDKVFVKELEQSAGKYCFECNNTQDIAEQVVFPILNYEHYCAVDEVSGMEFNIEDGQNHCISVELPANYKGCIKFYYRERSVWKLAFVISALCAMYIVISAFLTDGKIHSRKKLGEEKV